MMEYLKIEKFNFTYIKNSELTVEPIRLSDFEQFKKQEVFLPHDAALSVTEYKTANELYYSDNILSLQEKEDLHLFYYTSFFADEGEAVLKAERIDLFSKIILNGETTLETDNAFLSFEKKVRLKKENEIIIHIYPAMLKAREFEIPACVNMLNYNLASSYLRKPAHMFGWDIFPRQMLGGIFGGISFCKNKSDAIESAYFFTNYIKEGEAGITVKCCVDLQNDDTNAYEIEIEGVCGDSRFHARKGLWANCVKFNAVIKDPALWEIKNMGAPNLYMLKIRLYYKGQLKDEYCSHVGIRTVKLEKSNAILGEQRFDFIVNGRKSFILGTNWVPVDTLYSLRKSRLPKALNLLKESGCNMVRVWGGGHYESDEFYDFCDENGILVWQDFMMACGQYPQDDYFCTQIKKECEAEIKRLRNHPSLALWAGDNECDMFTVGFDKRINPNKNILTRSVIPQTLNMHDGVRDYLPSSPYIDETAFASGGSTPEEHTWGPRNYFRSDYYKNLDCAFISETGYFGLPDIRTLERFIPQKNINEFLSAPYIIHSTSMTKSADSPYYYRMGKTIDNAKALFEKPPTSLGETILFSQITEGEALKYFIERMRVRKNTKGGIIWWNLLDGWPQISDSAVDYYFNKKLAFSYIQKSQQYFCLMLNEENESLVLYAANDTPDKKAFVYKVTNLISGQIIKQANGEADANGLVRLDVSKQNGRAFYLIEWETDGIRYTNHYVTDIKGIDSGLYLNCLNACGYSVCPKTK